MKPAELDAYELRRKSWFWRMVDQITATQSPFALIKRPNPVFELELRHTQWPRHPEREQFLRYISSTGCIYPVGLGIIGSLCILLAGRYSFEAIALSFFPLVVLSFLFDVLFLLASINSINTEMNSGHWDMLRLTALPTQDILAAKYAIAQIRAWRSLAVEIGLRALVSLTAWGSFFLSTFPYNYFYQPSLFITSFGLALIAVLFIIEPVWRMRALTAIGLAISAQGASSTVTPLAGFGALVGTRLLQAALLIGVFWGYTRFAVYAYDSADNIVAALFISIAAAAVLMYLLFKMLQSAALRRAAFAAFQSD